MEMVKCPDCGAEFEAGTLHWCPKRDERLTRILGGGESPPPTPRYDVEGRLLATAIPAELAEVLKVSPMDVQGAIARVRQLQQRRLPEDNSEDPPDPKPSTIYMSRPIDY